MKRQEAIWNFVKNNYGLLTEKDIFQKAEYKAILRDYFGKTMKFKFGVPKDKEICDSLVEFIIKLRKINKEEDLGQIINETPLLKMNNIKADDYVHILDLTSKKFVLKQEVSELKGIEKIERIVEFVKKEMTKEIEDLILHKKEEYLRLPSILDDRDFSEPEELFQRDETREWWEELNLRENPFPGPLDGFFLINKSLYDEIIVETPPILWALNKITKEEIEFFHKGYLLGGEFGTGKTTFFDFMAPHLTVKRIEPIRIALSDNINVAHYIQKFEKEICVAIAKIAKNYGIPSSSRIIDFEEARLLMLDLQTKGVKGFFIFLDDLHKNIDLNCVFNFLANLQITKNTLSRDGINVAFLVAGFPDWRARIKQDSALTGFFDAADELTLPEVTPEIAAQAIRKRLQAFSTNPEKEIAIKEEFLRTVFKRVSSEIGRINIGFRPYIQEALNNFSAKKFDILSIDFTRLDDRTMYDIKNTLESNTNFKESIDKLIFGGKIQKREIRELTLKILCEVYIRKGVSEEEEIFNKNRFSFKRLMECSLIQKYDRSGKLIWKISPMVHDLNKKVISLFKLSMEDYLVPIYSVPSKKPKEEKTIRNKIEVYGEDLIKWSGRLERAIIDELSKALKMYGANILQYTDTDPQKAFPVYSKPEIEKIEDCIWMMMKCIIRFESPLLLDVYGEAEILGWTLRHRSLESSQHFIAMQKKLEKGPDQKTDMARLISFANDSFSELWGELKKSINVYESSQVRCYAIPRDILKTIYSEYDQIFSSTRPREEYLQTINKFVELVETSIRQYLLVSCTLIFGPYHRRIKYYPQDIKKYIINSSISSTSYENYNEFENLNRGQYRLLFTQVGKSTELYRFIVEPVMKNWDSLDLNSFFQLFGDLNIMSSHRKSQIIEDKKKDVPTFFRLSCRLIASISERLKDLVVKNNSILHTNDQSYVVFGYQPGKNIQDRAMVKAEDSTDCPSALFRHDITGLLKANNINRIMENSDNRLGDVELDIWDIEGTRIKFGMTYSQTIGLIAYLLASYQIRGITLYGTNICLRRIESSFGERRG
jgi:hypothetical protein